MVTIANTDDPELVERILKGEKQIVWNAYS